MCDQNGNLLIDGFSEIRKVDSLGIITTIAGNGTEGYNRDGGPATAAQITNTVGLCVDGTGNIYFVDGSVHRIRKIDINGIITTVAGDGSPVYNGDNISALAAGMQPMAVAVYSGYLYICDGINNRVRKLTNDGIITTVAGDSTRGYNGDGEPAIAAELYAPYGIAFDSCHNLYVADVQNYRIRKVIFDSSCGSVVDTTTAVQHIKSGGFSVYPNPVSKDLTLTLSINGEGTITNIALYNMVGQVVYDKTFVQQKKITIDISALPNGVYFVKVNGIYVQKVIKE